MAGETTTANMNLVLPGVGVTAGPQYATDLNASLTIIDSHNHSSGSGVPITPSGLNITSDLSMQSNNLTLARSVRFAVQSLFSSASDNGSVFYSGVDLYFRDGNGNNVRITQSGGVAGTTGSIGGLVAPASATYVPANQTFVWQSNVNTAANMDCGSIKIREIAASANAITFASPSALAANYAITLPQGLPSADALFTVTSSGTASFKSANVNIYESVVGTSAQVTGGIATHSTLSAAITATAANGTIKLLQGAWTENITVSKTLNIVGSGRNSVITGNLTISSANYCNIRDLQFTGNISTTGTSTGNCVQNVFIGSSSTFSDTNTVSDNGNFYHFIQG